MGSQFRNTLLGSVSGCMGMINLLIPSMKGFHFKQKIGRLRTSVADGRSRNKLDTVNLYAGFTTYFSASPLLSKSPATPQNVTQGQFMPTQVYCKAIHDLLPHYFTYAYSCFCEVYNLGVM